MLEKKYFSISEACDMCALVPHKLRYIDKIDKKISIIRIRGRRYYTLENINYLIHTYSNLNNPIDRHNTKKIDNTKNNPLLIISDIPQQDNNQLLQRIDQLIQNFHILATRLN